MSNELFVGIDVSKAKFDVATLPASEQRSFDNDQRGISALVKWLDQAQPQLVVMEATGGYQSALEGALDLSVTAARDRLGLLAGLCAR